MIPFCNLSKINKLFGSTLTDAVERVINSGRYISGRETEMFEREFADYCNCRHAIGTGNGFDAIYLLLRAYIETGRLTAGDEILVPANTYVATIAAIIHAQCVPVLVDPDLNSFVIGPQQISDAITPRTQAIVAVHLYGRLAPVDEIRSITGSKGLLLIEDASQAHGALSPLGRAGCLGDAAAFSFYPTKNLGAFGDGGAVTTNDTKLAEAIRILGNYGNDTSGVARCRGVNSRLDELQSAVLRVKLQQLDRDNERRRSIARRYIEGIAHKAVITPEEPSDPAAHVWHLFIIRCTARDSLKTHLDKNGIETCVHYPIPPHHQPAYRAWNSMSFPVTEQIHREVLSLPLNTSLDDEDIKAVISAVNRWHA